MTLVLIINSIICLLGIVGCFFLVTGSIISISNMTISWAWVLLRLVYLIPTLFFVSGIGSWIAVALGATTLAWWFIAAPWICLGVFITLMLIAFKVA